jgi:hypothetical protein
MYYSKKLDYQEAHVKGLLKRPACMLTGLGLSRNLNSKITINAWHIAAVSRHSLMRIQEYWTTHGVATRRGFTYPVMWIPKTHVCGVVKTRMHCSRNPSIPRKSACSVRYHTDTTTWKQASTSHLSSRLTWACVITAANNWAHVLRHNCNKSSYVEHTGGHFQHLRWQPHFIQVWHANVRVNQHFPGLPSSGTHCII